MLDQDNVSVEKISINNDDFSNDFGIQDTQVLNSNDLQNYLLSDPDDVKKVEETEKKEKSEEVNSGDDKNKDKKPETEEKPDGREILEGLIFDDEKNEKNKNQNQKTNEDNKENTESKKSEPNNQESDDTYSTLSKDLLRLGVFTQNSEEETEENIDIKTPEQFLERFALERKKGAINILDNFLSQFGEDYRKMFDAVFVNGVKPQEYLQTFSKIETIKDLDLASENNQERVVRAYYRELKWDDNKIENKITKLKDYGDLEEEAKAYHEILLNKEKEQAANLEKQKIEEINKTKEKEAAAKKSYNRILTEKFKTQEFDGIPVTQRDIEETIEYMSEKKYKLASGELLSEYDKDLLELNRTENHELKVKLGLLLRKKLDLTPIKKATISKKSDALFTLSTKNAKEKSKEKEIKSFF